MSKIARETRNDKPLQLTLFASSSPSAMPDMNFDLRIRSIYVEDEAYFSLFDIFSHYGSDGSSSNPAMYWKRAQARLEKQGAHNITGVLDYQFVASDGKKKKPTPIVNLEAFLRIIQVVDIQAWESMRAWMARNSAKKIKDTALERVFIEDKMNQGFSFGEATDFVRQAMIARETRNDWTAALQAAVIGAVNYGQATNAEYMELFGKTAKEIREITGFKVARDGMTTEGRAIVTAVEATMSKMFLKYKDITFDQALGVIRDVCAAYQISVVNVERLLGIELSTGRKLLR